MRLLVLDHFFGQDIEGLRASLSSEDELRTIPYDLLRFEALRVLPEEVADGLEPFASPELEPQRREWAGRLRAILEEEFMRWPYDAFVVPSDIFFYVRAGREVCHDLGVPFFCLQKETTISGLMMEFAEQVRRYAPPLVDHMTVCGERLRDFWVRAGADPATITITGQPRFDFYRHPERWPSALPYGEGGPVALFLSYHIDHHHPTEGQGIPVWAALHEQTERRLWELARRGWRVVVKPHPQQPWQAERRRIRRATGELLGDRVFLAEPLADARELIAGADVIVGFQSTALIEALLARKPVVYTGWDPAEKDLRDDLIPVARWTGLVDVVEDEEAFVATVEGARGRGYTTDQEQRIDDLVEHYLGRVDGDAGVQAVAVLRERVAEFEAARSPEVEGRRARTAARRPPLHPVRDARHGLRRLRPRVGALLGR